LKKGYSLIFYLLIHEKLQKITATPEKYLKCNSIYNITEFNRNNIMKIFLKFNYLKAEKPIPGTVSD